MDVLPVCRPLRPTGRSGFHSPPKKNFSDPALTPLEARLLRLLCTLVQDFSPRDIPVVGQLPLPIVVYSDASFENGVLRLGWVIFVPNGTPLGGTTVVPHQVVSSWKERSQQIFPGETLCALVLPLLYPTTLVAQPASWMSTWLRNAV